MTIKEEDRKELIRLLKKAIKVMKNEMKDKNKTTTSNR